jgi:hypothetical protein
MRKLVAIAAVTAAFVAGQRASATSMAITEWMYSPGTGTNPGPGEFYELTNLSGAPIDMTGWSQDDNNRTAGKHSLSAFGVVQPRESVIGTEGSDASAFKTYWNLPASVKVIAYGSSDGLGRPDEINIYDSTNALVDRLTYDDQTIGGLRTQGTSGNIAVTNLTGNHANFAVASNVGDTYLSYRGGLGVANSDVGNPGVYALVPEPTSLVLATISAVIALAFAARCRA